MLPRIFRLLNLGTDWFRSWRFLFNHQKSLTIPFPIAINFMMGVCLAFVVAACNSNASVSSSSPSAAPVANTTAPTTNLVRFGYQKSSILLKAKGLLEKRLRPEGVKVEWTEFPAGPQMMEALNAGSIDIGPVGESPPIFAQAAGASIIYAAAIAPTPKSSAVLVPKDSPLKSVADLKGKIGMK